MRLVGGNAVVDDHQATVVARVPVPAILDKLLRESWETRDETYNAIARQRGIKLKPLPPDQDRLNVLELIRELRAPGLLRLKRDERAALADSLERLL